MPVFRTRRWGALGYFIAIIGLGVGTGSSAEQTPPGSVPGSVSFPAYVLPPSEFLSPEMRVAIAARVDLKPSHAPGEDAPMSEWEAFWKNYDEHLYHELPRAKELYPSNLEDKVIGGVETIVVTPKSGIAARNRHRVLINLHGGGFFAGWGAGAVAPSIPVASDMGIKIITVNYREMPKNRYPAASEDVATVYRELLKEYPPDNIGIYGCSAGGILAAQAIAWFQAHDLPRPGAIGIFCAGSSFNRGDSSIWNTSGHAAEPNLTTSTVRLGYLKGADMNSPLVSPASSVQLLAKFPPTLIMTATRDPLMSAAIVLHTQLLKLGVESQLYIIEGGWHGSVEQAPDTPESRDANAFTAKWFDSHLGTRTLTR